LPALAGALEDIQAGRLPGRALREACEFCTGVPPNKLRPSSSMVWENELRDRAALELCCACKSALLSMATSTAQLTKTDRRMSRILEPKGEFHGRIGATIDESCRAS
jgi:hypothetical protein